MEKKKLLIAEDSPELSYVLEVALSKEGFEIHPVKDGFEAVRAVRKVMPDLILIDIMLPKQDGLQVTRLLKFDKIFQHIPMVIMTSMAGSQVEEQAFNAGADYFLRKPFDIDDLTMKLKRLSLGEKLSRML